MYSSTFLGNIQYLHLYLSIFQMHFDFQVLFRVHLSTFGFLSHYFPNTKWVTGVDGTSCSLIASVSNVATEWGPLKPTG